MGLEVDVLKLYWTLEKEKTDAHQGLSGGWQTWLFLLFSNQQPQWRVTVVLTSALSTTSPPPLPQWLRQASYKASQIPTEIAQVSAGKEKGNNSSGLSEYCFLFHLGEHLKDMPKLSLSGKVILYADLTWDKGRRSPLPICALLFAGGSSGETRRGMDENPVYWRMIHKQLVACKRTLDGTKETHI